MLELRKNLAAQARRLGPEVLLRFLVRRLRIRDLVGVGRRLFDVTVAPVILPFAESGMDVDKPHQLAQVEEYLQKRATARRA
jgi:hypothetical protein